MGERRIHLDCYLDAFFSVADNNQSVAIVLNMKSFLQKDEKPAPCLLVLTFSYSDCPWEKVAVSIKNGCNKNDPAILCLDVAPVKTKHFC